MRCDCAIATYGLLAAASANVLQVSIEQDGQGNSEKLKLSAVINNPQPPHNAEIECWELEHPLLRYPAIGSSMQLANITNITYVQLPADSEGLHNTPHPMLFVLLSGTATVTLPNNSNEVLEIVAGANLIIAATDTIGKGHYARYTDTGRSPRFPMWLYTGAPFFVLSCTTDAPATNNVRF